MIRFAPYLPPRMVWRLLTAAATLAFAALAFVQAGLGAADRAFGAEAWAVANQIAADKPVLRRWLREGRIGPEEAAPKPPDPQAFLTGVETALERSGVQVTRLAQVPSTSGNLNVEVTAPWDRLLTLFAAMEAMGGVAGGLGIHSDPDGTLRASFSLSPGPPSPGISSAPGASPATPPNPFTPAAPPVDLSRYHLTAVTRFGATAMATINGRDYLLGDALDGLTVGAMGDSTVQLGWSGGTATLSMRTGSEPLTTH